MRIFVESGQRPEILDRVEDLGFVVFKNQDFDLNIIAERNPNGEVDQFDDWLHVLYLENDEWQWHAYTATTDAGSYYLQNFGRRAGTAILCHPQQMRGVYKIDLHGGKYEALCQRNGPVLVWRDPNKDNVHDMQGETEEGYFGINIHRSSSVGDGADTVGRYSAGCTVIQDPEEFAEFMTLCHKQVEETGFETFTYTLILGN